MTVLDPWQALEAAMEARDTDVPDGEQVGIAVERVLTRDGLDLDHLISVCKEKVFGMAEEHAAVTDIAVPLAAANIMIGMAEGFALGLVYARYRRGEA